MQRRSSTNRLSRSFGVSCDGWSETYKAFAYMLVIYLCSVEAAGFSGVEEKIGLQC